MVPVADRYWTHYSHFITTMILLSFLKQVNNFITQVCKLYNKFNIIYLTKHWHYKVAYYIWLWYNCNKEYSVVECLPSFQKEGGDMVKKREYVCWVLLLIAIILFLLLMIIVVIKKWHLSISLNVSLIFRVDIQHSKTECSLFYFMQVPLTYS